MSFDRFTKDVVLRPYSNVVCRILSFSSHDEMWNKLLQLIFDNQFPSAFLDDILYFLILTLYVSFLMQSSSGVKSIDLWSLSPIGDMAFGVL